MYVFGRGLRGMVIGEYTDVCWGLGSVDVGEGDF